MRSVVLTEYVASEPVPLTVSQRDTLLQLVRGLAITPAPGSTETYILRAGSTVGVVRVGDLTIEIRPKVGIAALLFLVSYALDARAWKPDATQLAHDANLAEAIIPLFVRATHHAIRPGLLHGYQSYDDTLISIRGRVRMADQFRARTGLPLPVEVVYDDFTPDIIENQLLLTAAETLGRIHLRHRDSQTSLARLRQQLNGVSTVVPDGRGVPTPHWSRLNERYRPAVGLARLIITTAGLEARAGGEDASSFLVDMNAVFEDFIRVALREALQSTPRAFPAAAARRHLHLDLEHDVPLEPDLSWWSGTRCVFVGDCKYKKTTGTVPNADIYQMLAYLTALELQQGLLVYAEGEDTPHSVTIPLAGKKILIRTVDVTQTPHDVLAQVGRLATTIRRMASSTDSAAVAS